ncbi:DUF6221 family protein [Nocardia sp. N2S4-5]|uniref:DUF6221 family protein n=1 Tax=Nocardia sp. N2S4-5 TaxID=3351565 RepID=UPI0037D7E582
MTIVESVEIRAASCKYPNNHPDESAALRAMAWIWSTHPDYREEWRVDVQP